MKKATFVAALALGTFGLAQSADAQYRPEIQGGYSVDLEAPYVGVGLRGQMASLPLTLAPHVDYYITDKGTAVQGNVDGLYHIGGGVAFTPYIGAGLAFGYEKGKSDTNNCTGTGLTACELDTDGKFGVGGSLVVGADLAMPAIRPFIQARLTAGLASGVGIGAGIVF